MLNTKIDIFSTYGIAFLVRVLQGRIMQTPRHYCDTLVKTVGAQPYGQLNC